MVGSPAVSLKSSAEMAEALRSVFNAAELGEWLNKAHWSTLFLDSDIHDSQLYQLVDACWQWVVAGLPVCIGNTRGAATCNDTCVP